MAVFIPHPPRPYWVGFIGLYLCHSSILAMIDINLQLTKHGLHNKS